MSINATVILDLGNSESRVIVKFEKEGRKFKKKFEMDNRFYKVSNDYQPPYMYTPDTTTLFAIEGEYEGRYANGLLVEKEFPQQCERPSGQSKKYSKHSCLTLSLAILRGSEFIAETLGTDISALDCVWKVVALMPTEDCNEAGIKKLAQEFEKIKVIHDIYNTANTVRDIKVFISKVLVFPEGFAAYVGCIYDENVNIRKGYEKYLDATILLEDIGAGTTDITVLSKGEVIDNTRYTIAAAGNNVRSGVKQKLKSVYGYTSVTDEQAEFAVKEGYIIDGTKRLDVCNLVQEVKQSLANRLLSETQDFLDSSMYPIRNVNYLLPVGGGTMSGNDERLTPVSNYLLQYLKGIAPNMEIIPLPVVMVDGVETTVSPRELNILGADVLSEVKG